MATADNDNINVEGSGGHEAGARFGNYEIVRPVGKGKFAIVYRAKAINTTAIAEAGDTVALKRINVDSIDDKSRDKCLKEVKLLQNLDHPNIIKYLDSFINENDLVIVVEWAAAGDLKRQLRKAQEKGVGFEERIIWKYFSQICDAIEHMHERRTMHRDLKPANIFLTLDGKVKVGDLGLSRELSEHTLQAHSKVGTPLYMSPEVLRGDGYDFKSDIWSLGCMLYELAMLKSPFKAEGLNLYSLFQKISQGDYQPLPENYSEELRSLTYGMISTRSEDRPDIETICQTARKMRNLTQDRYIQSKKSGGSSNSSSDSKAESTSADMSTSSGGSNLKIPNGEFAATTVEPNEDKEYVPVPRSRSGSLETGGGGGGLGNKKNQTLPDQQFQSSAKQFDNNRNSNVGNQYKGSGANNETYGIKSNLDGEQNSFTSTKPKPYNSSNNSNFNTGKGSNNNQNNGNDDLYASELDNKNDLKDTKSIPTIPQASYRVKKGSDSTSTNQRSTNFSDKSREFTSGANQMNSDSKNYSRQYEQRSETDLDKLSSSSLTIPLMESIYNKLNILGFSFYDKKKMTCILLPIHFALDLNLVAGSGAKLAGSQFRKLVEVTQWICKKSNITKAVDIVDRIDFDKDAPIMISRILLSLFDVFKVTIPAGEEILPTNLIQGHGESPCRYLLYLIDRVIEIISFHAGHLKYPGESVDTYNVDAGNDDDAIEEDEVMENGNGNSDGNGEHVMDGGNEGGDIDYCKDSHDANSTNLLVGSMIIPSIDPLAWKEEAERVSSKLTKSALPAASDWLGHLDQIATHLTNLRGIDWQKQEKSSKGVAILNEANEQLKLVSAYTSSELEIISRVEGYINKMPAIYSIIGQYQSYKAICDEYSIKVLDSNSKISEYTAKLDEIVSAIDEFSLQMSTLAGNDGNQTSPLIKVKEAIVRIKGEINNINIRTGIMASSLLQSRHNQNKDAIQRRLNKNRRAKTSNLGGKNLDAAYENDDDVA